MVLASCLGVPAPTSLLGSPSQGRRCVRAPSHTAPMTCSTLPLVLRGQRVPGVALRFKGPTSYHRRDFVRTGSVRASTRGDAAEWGFLRRHEHCTFWLYLLRVLAWRMWSGSIAIYPHLATFRLHFIELHVFVASLSLQLMSSTRT
ncbi:hypothetical protein VNO77_03806 [Canavalia gladiata]|uniref:Uncharacterized protein n=1 Tax=Canavalia gladiata TaxID=3824 RepID=A0AAN9RCK6_CANGL